MHWIFVYYLKRKREVQEIYERKIEQKGHEVSEDQSRDQSTTSQDHGRKKCDYQESCLRVRN